MATLKYNEKFPAIAEDLAANGESDEYIAFRLQISMATFYNYKAQFPEFAEALVVGRKVCYSRVRAKLLKLAQGRCTVITEVYKDGELQKTIERQLPPNLKAIVYFQKHMRVGGRLSGEFCLRQDGQRTVESTQPQTDSKMLAVRLVPQSCDPYQPLDIKTSPAQTDSKMSNGQEWRTEQTERTNPTDQLAVRLVPQSGDPIRPTAPTTPAVPENIPAQRDSGISNLKVESENILPQADSKMSNERCVAGYQASPAKR